MSELSAALFGHWKHSHEEDEGDTRAYRPSDHEFPPARGREGFEIHQTGQFVRYDIHPSDQANVARPGRWVASGPDRITVQLDEPGLEPFDLVIVSVDEELLRVREEPAEDTLVELATSLSPTQSCGLAPFEWAEVTTVGPPGATEHLLVVSGTLPVFNMSVELVPLSYIQRPDYWGIEVVACLPGEIMLPALRPYTVWLGVTDLVGTEGIEVIGAEGTRRFELPELVGWDCTGWEAIHHQELPGPGVLEVSGTCTFPTTGYSVTLRPREPQGTNPKDLLLDLEVQAPSPDAIVGFGFTTVQAHYREEDLESAYDTVTILPGGATVEVQQIS